jgi:hypothetical protein
MIKRQKRLMSPTVYVQSNAAGDDEDFFSSPRCVALEASRRKLFRLIASS